MRRGADRFHDVGGPLRCRTRRRSGRWQAMVRRVQAGIPRNCRLQRRHQEGAATADDDQQQTPLECGRRLSAAGARPADPAIVAEAHAARSVAHRCGSHSPQGHESHRRAPRILRGDPRLEQPDIADQTCRPGGFLVGATATASIRIRSPASR